MRAVWLILTLIIFCQAYGAVCPSCMQPAPFASDASPEYLTALSCAPLWFAPTVSVNFNFPALTQKLGTLNLIVLDFTPRSIDPPPRAPFI